MMKNKISFIGNKILFHGEGVCCAEKKCAKIKNN